MHYKYKLNVNAMQWINEVNKIGVSQRDNMMEACIGMACT